MKAFLRRCREPFVLVVLVLAGAAVTSAETPVVPVSKVVLEEIDAHTIRVHLRVPELPATTPRLFLRHTTLVAGEIAIPTQTPARVEMADGHSWIRFDAPLAAVPAEVLSLPLEPMTIRWQGLGPDGRVLLAAERVVDPLVRRNVVLEPWDLFIKYGKVTRFSVWPSLDGLRVRAMLMLYNPMSFPVTVERAVYRVDVAGRRLLDGTRSGFTIGSRTVTEIDIDETVAISDVVRGGVDALLKEPSYRIWCELHLLTPGGTSVLSFSRHNGGEGR